MKSQNFVWSQSEMIRIENMILKLMQEEHECCYFYFMIICCPFWFFVDNKKYLILGEVPGLGDTIAERKVLRKPKRTLKIYL